ncbi:CRP-like cAMP-activated global transcriptional regulator (plasmid) [Pseudoseohaeicola sp. NH-UV-7]|uniref:Crp/Fnr family transcriptional regulator n=1 Tax=unclassified Sulfitobacter TaxID=196795 RepID=UPI000E0B38E4|nr:Crp/Fnr family transcriptional regulator [Sulfitobacter sp. JL08]AXI56482.1 Crp/Fnr family transcriptional regulator [Sulfitobacter sp. JL08]
MAPEPLHSFGFMAGASPGLTRLMGSVASKVSLEPNAVLFEQGDAGDALYAIVSGALEVSVLSRDGRKLALDIFRQGALFGEIALFDPGPRTATVTAIEPCVLHKIKNADLLREIRSDPDLAEDLIRLAGQRMRWMGDQLSEQVFLPMPMRLARRILHLTDTEHDTLTLSQSVLADHVGATREAVSKTMAAWRKAGVISSLRGGMKVLDRAALRALADLT